MATTVSVSRDRGDPKIGIDEVAASTKILAGTLVNYDANKNVVPAADTAGHVFAGVPNAEVDNSAGSAGDKKVENWKNGRFLFKLQEGSATIALLGTQVYVYDNDTVCQAATATNDISVGFISGIYDANNVWVNISVFDA